MIGLSPSSRSARRCSLNESSTFSTDVYVPIVNWTLDLSWGYYVLLFLLIAGTVNGANLTDGIDGLAAGTS